MVPFVMLPENPLGSVTLWTPTFAEMLWELPPDLMTTCEPDVRP